MDTPPEPAPKPKHRFWIILLVILVNLALIELGARYLFSNNLPLEANRSIKIATGENKSRVRMVGNAFWHHQLTERYNRQLSRWNTRGPDFTQQKPADEIRIICVGDSATYGWKNRENETYPYYLQQILQPQFPGKKIKVINAGVPGFNSAFALSYLALRLINFHPDLVIIKVGYNDIFAYLTPGLRADYTNIFPRPAPTEITNPRFWKLARHIYTLRLLGYILLDPPVSRNFFGVWTREATNNPQVAKGYWEKMLIHKSYVKSMISICRGRHVPVVLLDLPSSPKPEHYKPNKHAYFGKSVKKIIARLSKNIIELGREMKVPVVITQPRLGPQDFFDHSHNTPSGNRKIAEMLAPVVRKILSERK